MNNELGSYNCYPNYLNTLPFNDNKRLKGIEKMEYIIKYICPSIIFSSEFK